MKTKNTIFLLFSTLPFTKRLDRINNYLNNGNSRKSSLVPKWAYQQAITYVTCQYMVAKCAKYMALNLPNNGEDNRLRRTPNSKEKRFTPIETKRSVSDVKLTVRFSNIYPPAVQKARWAELWKLRYVWFCMQTPDDRLTNGS